MKRRAFITLIGGSAAAWPLAARAQKSERMRRIGVLATLPLPPVQRFFRKLQEYGYVEGRNLQLEARFARTQPHPSIAELLLTLPRAEAPGRFYPWPAGPMRCAPFYWPARPQRP
jgi:hypothetical protein